VELTALHCANSKPLATAMKRTDGDDLDETP
jgi:hypothetical protein